MCDVTHDLDVLLDALRRNERCGLCVRVGINAAGLTGLPCNRNVATIEVCCQPVAFHASFEGDQATVDDGEDDEKDAGAGVCS